MQVKFFKTTFTLKTNIKMRNEKLGQSEHEEVLLDNVSKLVINRNYIYENFEFFDAIIFKLYEDYIFSLEPISITKQAKTLEMFLGCLLRYKPSNELPEDTLKGINSLYL